MSAEVTRRRFVNILVGCLGVLGLNPLVRALTELYPDRVANPLALKLADFFTYKDSAAIIGREYLRCVPGEADLRLLVDLICSFRTDLRLELAKADTERRRELLLLQQRQDFEQGRIVRVQRWILSETEVRLCALTALV